VLEYLKVQIGGIILNAETKGTSINGKPISMELIEEILDNKTEDEIVEMIMNGGVIDWTVLAAMQVYVDTSRLFPVKFGGEDWRSILMVEQGRLDVAQNFLRSVPYKLEIKGFLTSIISEEWRSKKPGHDMYSIEYLTSSGTETQYLIGDNGSHNFTSLEDAVKFLEPYQVIHDIIAAGKSVKAITTVVIVVEQVIERIEIKR